MKIIHFHPDLRMSLKFVMPLIDAEKCNGLQSELICSNKNSDLEAPQFNYDLSFSNILILPLAFWKIWRYLKFYNPEIIISHNSKSSLIPLLCAYLAGIKVRLYFNHGVPYVGHKGLTRTLLFVIEWLNTILSTEIITVSNDMQLLLKRVNSKTNSTVINSGSACGINLQAFQADPIVGLKWRTIHGISHDDLVVVYVGRPEKRKGFDFVVKLWKDRIHDMNIKLVLCGPNLNEVLKLQSYLPENIIPLGFVDNMPDVLSGSDVMILPSLHEGLSYACLEAQASRLIVIANDIPGTRCLINDKKTGFLVPKNDPNKYFEIIQMINQNRNSFEMIKQSALSNAQLFSREKFIPEYLSFIKSLIICC